MLSQAFPDLDFAVLESGAIRVESDQPVGVGPLVRLLETHAAEVVEPKRVRPSLEEIFVRITGIEADAMRKDMRTYYLKPPNVSWGIIFPLAWTGMFFIKSGSGLDGIMALRPGVVAISILFGTTSMQACGTSSAGGLCDRFSLFLRQGDHRLRNRFNRESPNPGSLGG